MTNFEFYKNEISRLAGAGKTFGVVNDKPVDCDTVVCINCDLRGTCSLNTIKWLYAEHVERPKINKKTKDFFDLIETGWVARDSTGSLYVYTYTNKPAKGRSLWIIDSSNETMRLRECVLPFLTLDFITWEDEEPWRVEDIRNLEVV